LNSSDPDSCKKVLADTIDFAKASGADMAEASLATSSALDVDVRLGEVDKLSYQDDKLLEIVVYVEQKKARVTTTDLSFESIERAAKTACEIATYAEQDKYAGLADKDKMATSFQELDLFHPTDISSTDAIELALECERIALKSDKRLVNSGGASFVSKKSYHAYANSHGFNAGYPSTSYSLACQLIAQENGATQAFRDYEYSVARAMEDLASAESVGSKAAENTIARIGARKIKTTKCPVLYHSRVAGSIINHLLAALSGGNIYRKTSFLCDALDKKILPEHLTINEDPHIKRGLGSSPFDCDGVLHQSDHIVASGILQRYILSSYSARRLGMETTGNSGGVTNITLSSKSPEQDLSSLCQTMQTGLLVTELMGHGINLTTGDYSRGAGGYWVENGKIAYPVEEISISGNLKDMLASIVAIGNDLNKNSNIMTGSILLDSMTIAGD